MDKEILRNHILTALRSQLGILERAVQTAIDATTHDDAKQEGKYDTRAIESSFIASAQSERLNELKARIHYVSHLPMRVFSDSDAISETALVTLMNEHGQQRHFLLIKGVSALEISHSNTPITVITPLSRLGTALINQHSGDEVQIDEGPNASRFEILAVQ